MSADDQDFRGEATIELGALTTIVKALQPLPGDARQRVVNSALVLLGSKATGSVGALSPVEQPARSIVVPTDIRGLKEQKNPKSANEMAALVAYYLAEVAQGSERKDVIELADIQKYFKQAQFRLPASPQMTLVNAKNAGYFDNAGTGRYKLNPVGYNLIAHSLPRGATTEKVQHRKSKKSRKKKT